MVKAYLIFWLGQTCSPGPTQKYLVSVSHGSEYVSDTAKISTEQKYVNFHADSLDLMIFLFLSLPSSGTACHRPRINRHATVCHKYNGYIFDNHSLFSKANWSSYVYTQFIEVGRYVLHAIVPCMMLFLSDHIVNQTVDPIGFNCLGAVIACEFFHPSSTRIKLHPTHLYRLRVNPSLFCRFVFKNALAFRSVMIGLWYGLRL